VIFSASRDKTFPIGLDIGFKTVRMLQAAQGDEGYTVRTADQMACECAPEMDVEQREAQVVEAVRQMLARSDFHRREVISCLPNDALKIKSLRLDTVDEPFMKQFIREEVAQHFGLDAERDEIRYLVAGMVHQGEETKNEVIFFGVDHATVERHLQLLGRCGLEAVSLDAIPCALFRSFQASHRRQEDRQLVSVFVDVGSLYTTVIIGRGAEIAFIKQIPIAGQRLNEDVAEALGVDVAEAGVLRARLQKGGAECVDAATCQAVIDAMSHTIENLAREVALCFRYYAVTFRGQRPEEMVFCGREAREVSLLNALRRHLGVDIRLAQPLRGFDLSRVDLGRVEQEDLGEWAVAVGLSIKGQELVACET